MRVLIVEDDSGLCSSAAAMTRQRCPEASCALVTDTLWVRRGVIHFQHDRAVRSFEATR